MRISTSDSVSALVILGRHTFLAAQDARYTRCGSREAGPCCRCRTLGQHGLIHTWLVPVIQHPLQRSLHAWDTQCRSEVSELQVVIDKLDM